MFARELWLLVMLLCTIMQAMAAAQVRETQFSATLDRSVRNGIDVYADERSIVIHIHNNGDVPEQLLDGRTGQPWNGSVTRLPQMRQVYDYASNAEASDSYLSRMGCRAWNVCTGLEGTSFVVMMREQSRTKLDLRVLDFAELFDSLERALSGQIHEAPATLSRIEVAALEEASAHALRPRLRDALRSISSLEQYESLERSRWLPLLRDTRVLTDSDAHSDPLQREIVRAQCRSLVVPLRPLIAQRQVEATRALAPVLHACRAEYIHVVDWFLEPTADQRREMAKVMLEVGTSQGDENLRQLGVFLGGVALAPPAPRGPAAFAPDQGTLRPGMLPPKRGDGKFPPPERRQDILEVDAAAQDQAKELAAINAVPNQIVLLAFSERGGLVTADSASLSGTVFRASVVEGGVEGGKFSVEALNSLKSAVRMHSGSYRVKINVKLFVARADRCVHPVYCLTRAKEILSSRNLVERGDFFLRPGNGFRDAQIFKFGPLRPPALDETSIYRSDLTEVRLVIELDGRIAPK